MEGTQQNEHSRRGVESGATVLLDQDYEDLPQ